MEESINRTELETQECAVPESQAAEGQNGVMPESQAAAEGQNGVMPESQTAADGNWPDYLALEFGLGKKDWTQYSPLTLAYIGDAVYELVIRTVLVKRANTQTAKLHQKASSLVKAGAQAELIKALLPHLTKEEEGVYRRGHNAKPYNTAKNASRREYLEATGFEALMGCLYLKEDYQRMIDLIKLGLEESGHAL